MSIIQVNPSVSEKLPAIDWRQVYDVLGFPLPKELRVGPDSVDLWSIVVDQSVTYFQLCECYKKLGIRVFNMDNRVADHSWVPSKGVFRITVARNLHPEGIEDSGGVSSRDFILNGGKAVTLRAQFLLDIGYYLATGEHLDSSESFTMCAGSYCAMINGLISEEERKQYQELPPEWKYVPCTLYKNVSEEGGQTQKRFCLWTENPFSRSRSVRPRLVTGLEILVP